MTTKLETTIHKWNGISSDIKPSSGVQEGSTYKYLDTKEKFIYHNGMWENDPDSIDVLNE